MIILWRVACTCKEAMQDGSGEAWYKARLAGLGYSPGIRAISCAAFLRNGDWWRLDFQRTASCIAVGARCTARSKPG